MEQSISYLGRKISYIVLEEFKHKKSQNSLKESIKMWVPTHCQIVLADFAKLT